MELENDNMQFPGDYEKYDASQLIDQYKKLYDDIKHAYLAGDGLPLPESVPEFDHIFVLGMGGSSISGAFLQQYLHELQIKVPLTVVQNYVLPPYVTERSLVLAISYSGNTEETVSAFRQALKITKFCYAFTTGGKIEEVCQIGRYPFLKIPKGYQPRTAALSHLFFSVLRVLERLTIIPPQGETIARMLKSLEKTDFPAIGSQLSEKIMYAIPIFYASDKYWPVAYRAKTQINEHAKIHAFWHKYPELNHNELNGYQNVLATYHIVAFRFDDDHRRTQKRMDLTKEIAKKSGVSTTEIKLTGESFLTKLFSAVLIGDYLAYYAALRYKTDPSPVTIIENFKKDMGPFI
jgi:glucose/mannose-6-phosphate isomerase